MAGVDVSTRECAGPVAVALRRESGHGWESRPKGRAREHPGGPSGRVTAHRGWPGLSADWLRRTRGRVLAQGPSGWLRE